MTARCLPLLALLIACQENEPHPPFIDLCEPGQHCPLSVGAGRMGLPDDPDPGGGGEAGGGGATDLSGTIVDFVDDTFSTSLPYADPAVVEGHRPEGTSVSTLWNGAEPFELKGVESADLSWISVRPQSGTANLRTLHPVATNVDQLVKLGLARAETFDEIFLQLALPKERAAGACQIVLTFTVTQAGVTRGVSGVIAVSKAADFTAYQAGGAWGIDPPRTDASGLVILGNVPAQAYPGNVVRVTLSGTASGFVDIQVAADAATVVEVPLTP